LAALLEAAARGQQVMATQRYEILHAVASGDHVVLEFRWVGTLAIPVGSLPAGGKMRGRCAAFLEFRDHERDSIFSQLGQRSSRKVNNHKPLPNKRVCDSPERSYEVGGQPLLAKGIQPPPPEPDRPVE
jgi:hypothetical protein